MRKLIVAVSLVTWTALGHANIASSILYQRTPVQQMQILANIVNLAGEPCDPTTVFFQGIDTYGSAYWDIACTDGHAFAIQISNDAAASATIIECSGMKSLGAPCFEGSYQ